MSKWQIEIGKLEAETHKLWVESDSLSQQHLHFKKKNRWYEVSVVVGIIAVGVALAKLLL